MTPNIRQYAAKQGFITGGCTFVICAILFFFMVKTDMVLAATYLDMSLTVGCTGLCCVIIQIFTIKGPVQKGLVPPAGDMAIQSAYLLYPKNSFAFLVLVTIAEVVLFAFAPIGVMAMFIADGGVVPKVLYIVIKAAMAALAGGYGTYHANVFVSALHQEKLTKAAA